MLIFCVSFAIAFNGATSNDWSMYKFNAARTGFNPMNDQMNSQLQLLWNYTDPQFSQNAGPESSPVIKNNILYLGTIAHSEFGAALLAFDVNTGQMLWHYSFGPDATIAV